METIMVNKKEMINAKNANYLADGVKKSLAQIDKFVQHNEYTMNANSLDEIKNVDIVTQISVLSLKKRKELRNYLWRISNHPSIGTINRYLHFIMKNILKSETRYKIVKSEKQLSIEEKRKKYREALAALKLAHADYKAAKGDFYKERLSKNQKI